MRDMGHIFQKFVSCNNQAFSYFWSEFKKNVWLILFYGKAPQFFINLIFFFFNFLLQIRLDNDAMGRFLVRTIILYLDYNSKPTYYRENLSNTVNMNEHITVSLLFVIFLILCFCDWYLIFWKHFFFLL